MHPAIENADVHKVAYCPRSYWCLRGLGKIGCVHSTQHPQPLTGDFLEFCQHMRTRPPASEIDPHFIEFAHVVFDMLHVLGGVLWCLSPQQPRLGANDM
jgi:hypothetical protein